MAKKQPTRRRTGTPGTPKTRARKPKDWAPGFLAAFRDHGLVTEACKAAGVGRSTVYRRREEDEDFAQAWREIEDETTERMEAEALRRAVEGVEHDRTYDSHGNLLFTEIRYSDTLLIFLLKARKPGMYRDNVKVEHSGAGGGPVRHELAIGDPEVRGHLDAALKASAEAERAS